MMLQDFKKVESNYKIHKEYSTTFTRPFLFFANLFKKIHHVTVMNPFLQVYKLRLNTY